MKQIVAAAIFVAFVTGTAFADQRSGMTWTEFGQLVERQPHGPAFDCALARVTPIERRICASARLARLDQALNDIYGGVVLDSFHALSLAASEAAWLDERNRCATEACVARAYRSRIAALEIESAELDRRMSIELHHDFRKPFVASPRLRARLQKIAGNACLRVAAIVDAGDDRASLLAHTCGECRPADGVLIFHPEGAGYRLIFREPECYVSGLFTGFEDERSHGLRRIQTASRSAAGDHSTDFYDYDGRVYRHVGAVEQYWVQNDHRRAYAWLGDGAGVAGNLP